MDFIFKPGLVLYLPLYELDGASVMSHDACGHLATVTGAQWRPGGRYFDRTDDKMQTGATVPINANNIYTAIVWARTNVNADENALLSFGSTSPTSQYLEHFSLRFLRPYFENWAGSGVQGSLLEVDTWYHLAAIHDGVNNRVRIYINGTLDLDTAYATDLLTTTGVVSLGCLNKSPLGFFFGGVIGEALVYNRALLVQEIQRHYLLSNWRYR